MKGFKTLLHLLLCSTLLAPSQPQQTKRKQKNDKPKVLSTTGIIHDFIQEIGGERIDAMVLIQGDVDPHTYELVKGDSDKLLLADAIFASGLGLEHGASLSYFLHHQPNVLFLGDEIQKIDPQKIIHIEGQTDPHLWMDLSLWQLTIEPILNALIDLDPLSAAYFKENAQRLKQKVQQTDTKIFQILQQIPPQRRFLVTSHNAFNYFTRRYLCHPDYWKEWKIRCMAPEGLSPESQLSLAELERIVDHVVNFQIEVLFPESNVSRASLDKMIDICQHKGVKVKISEQILYADSLGTPGSDAGSYLEMMQHNANALAKEWQ